MNYPWIIKCPICGKEFFATTQHAWVVDGEKLCSYHCTLEAERRKPKAKRYRRIKQ